jgi:hypothetical protein
LRINAFWQEPTRRLPEGPPSSSAAKGPKRPAALRQGVPMQYRLTTVWAKYSGLAAHGPLMAGVALAGAAASAAGTIAGGSSAAAMGRAQAGAATFEAKQAEMNAGGDIAASQRRMFETQQKTNLLTGTATARAGASGVDAGVGSAAENVGQIQQRGRYAAALDLWNGQNAASGELNRAAGLQYQSTLDEIGGKAQQDASYYSAASTIAGGGASAYKLWPQS